MTALMENQDVTEFDKQLAVNLRGPVLCIKHAARAMKRAAPTGGGCIINTSSIAGLTANCGVAGAPPFYVSAGKRA